MIDYTGSRCPVCDKKFNDDDDIVVCPSCGAPHHRECYAKAGQCAFEHEHINGKAWSPSKPLSTTTAQQPARPSTRMPGDSSDQVPLQPPPRPPAPVGKNASPYPNMDDPPATGFNRSRPPQSPGSHNGTERTCSSCGSKNPSTNLFCNLCGNWLGEGQGAQEPSGENEAGGRIGSPFSQLGQQMQFDPKYALYGGLSPDEKIEDYTVHDVATYVGKSSSYYVPRFKAISDTEKNFSNNFSAFLFHGFYFLYRKMYAIGSILLAIFVISAIPSVLYTKEAMHYDAFRLEVGIDEQGRPVEAYDAAAMARLQRYQVMSNRTRMVFLVISLITSLLANRLYYDHSMKRIGKALQPYPNDTRAKGKCIECENALSRAGGVSIAAVVVFLVVLVVAATGYLSYELFLK